MCVLYGIIYIEAEVFEIRNMAIGETATVGKESEIT